MSDFLNNLTDKLAYAYEPKLFYLDAFSATEITTANTVSTLATYSSNKLKGADIVKVAYLLTVDNQADANEAFTFTLDLGTQAFTRSITINTTDTDKITITAEVVRISDTNFLATVNFSRQTEGDVITSYPVAVSILDSGVTEVTVKAENGSAINAGCDLIGAGGYVLVDTF